jgi:hypothetical protein
MLYRKRTPGFHNMRGPERDQGLLLVGRHRSRIRVILAVAEG